MPHGAKGKGPHPWKEGKRGPWKRGKVGPWKKGKKPETATTAKLPPGIDFTPSTAFVGAQGKAAGARLARGGRGKSALGFGAGYLGRAEVLPGPAGLPGLPGEPGKRGKPGKGKGKKKKKGK